MQKKGTAAAGLFLFVVVVAQAFTGALPAPYAELDQTCFDGINNDGDFLIPPGAGPPPIEAVDSTDQECHFMPFAFGDGEFDGQGALAYPTIQQMDPYVAQWQLVFDDQGTITHFEAVQDATDIWTGDLCSDMALTDSLVIYRDHYQLPDEMTGIPEHQAECGVSY